MAWTDERLEERFDGIDRRPDEAEREMDEIARLIARLISVAKRWSVAIQASFLGVIVAILVKGV
ncbi:MAG TPA: hypothetical protein VFJ57_14255 [Solirubrobacterales bacterium]|nr:hypothetical protein [Solirubrobacterales bacterium]